MPIRFGSDELVEESHPLPVKVKETTPDPSFRGVGYSADYIWRLAQEGRLFIASDASSDALVLGQTSFANTTPTFLLQVPAGTHALPLFVNLAQAGSVAGGVIDVIMEIDNVDRFSTGGIAEKVFNPRQSRSIGNRCTLHSGATANAGYGMRVWGSQVGADIDAAEGAVQGPFWRPELPYFLEGPASFLIFTFAGATGPSWYWSIGWAEWNKGERLAD